MFDIRIVNLDAGSYLRMTPEKVLAKSEKENKDLYLQACLEHIRTFTPMVYSTDGRTLNGVAVLVGSLGQVQVPAELRADVSAHGFW